MSGTKMLKYICSVAFYLLFGFDKSATELCSSPSLNVSACGRDRWFELPAPVTCIKHFYEEKANWSHVENICKDKVPNSRGYPISFLSHIQLSTTKEYLSFRVLIDDYIWVSGNDRATEGIFLWDNGFPVELSITNWTDEAPQPSRTFQNNCLALDYSKFSSISPPVLTAIDCSEERPFICQKEHEVGPRELKMDIDYHRADGVHYLGVPMEISCSAFNPDDGYIQFFTDFIDPLEWTENVTHTLEMTETGYCTNKTTVTKFMESPPVDLDGLEVTCTSRSDFEQEWTDYCSSNSTKLSFCVQAPALKLIDGPKNRPDLHSEQSFSSKGLIVENSLVVLNCTVTVGTYGKLTWVVMPLSRDPTKLPSDEFKVESIEYNNGPERTVTEIVQFNISLRMSGVSFICFSHDVFKFNMKKECDESNQRFCAESIYFEVYEQPIQAPERSIVHLMPLFLLLFLLLLMPVGLFSSQSSETDVAKWIRRKTQGMFPSVSVSKMTSGTALSPTYSTSNEDNSHSVDRVKSTFIMSII